MRTIELRIDELLLSEVDRVSESLKISRSEFVREAIKKALWRQKILEMERHHTVGYTRHPVQPQEFATAKSDLAWGDS